MFIKIQTLYPIFHGEFVDTDWEIGKPAVINTDKIIDIQASGDNYLIDLGGEPHLYTISPSEYARIEPLLLGESPAPILPSAVFDSFNDLTDVMVNELTERDTTNFTQQQIACGTRCNLSSNHSTTGTAATQNKGTISTLLAQMTHLTAKHAGQTFFTAAVIARSHKAAL